MWVITKSDKCNRYSMPFVTKVTFRQDGGGIKRVLTLLDG